MSGGYEVGGDPGWRTVARDPGIGEQWLGILGGDQWLGIQV